MPQTLYYDLVSENKAFSQTNLGSYHSRAENVHLLYKGATSYFLQFHLCCVA